MNWEYICTIASLTIVGLVMGSFAGAQVWRLRARQLAEDKAAGVKVRAAELKRLKPLITPVRTDRSRCLDCGHALHLIDLVPLVSWLSTRGRCRYCQKPIGLLEPSIEFGMAAVFVTSFVFWPYALDTGGAWLLFVVWLMSMVVAGVLFVYDMKWFLLPDKINYVYIGLGVVFATGQLLIAGITLSAVVSLLGALCILSGLYALLYLYSRAQYGEERTWVGFGDVKLGLGLGLFALTWPVAFIALFAANLLGTLLVLPGLIKGKLHRQSHIPFGPLLLLGTVIAVLFGDWIIDTYISLFLF